MAVKHAKRKFIDWNSVEPMYRAGILSLPEIACQYEADHIHSQKWKTTVTHQGVAKHAKEKGWTRNLANKVTERVREQLVAGEVAGCNQSESEMVETAAAEPIRVGRGQRARTQRLLVIQDGLAEELKDGKKKIDVMTRVRGFKDIAQAVRNLQDQQAEQYRLNTSNDTGPMRIKISHHAEDS